MLQLFKVTATRMAANVRAVLADLAGVGPEGATDASVEQASSQEVAQPLGFAARPSVTRTLFALAERLGDDVLAYFFVDKGDAALSPALEEGETRVYNLAGALIRLRANGDIEVTPKPGQNVILDGGSLKVARDTDPVVKSTVFGTWITNVEAALNTAGSTIAVPFAGTQIGTIDGGNANVKA